MAENTVPEATVVRIARSAGVDRLSGEAGKALVGATNDFIATVAQASRKVADHAGRKTVTADDISFVVANVI